MRATLRDRIEHAALEGLLAFLRFFPRRVSTAFAKGLVRLGTRIAPVRKRVALENLRLSFPGWTLREREATYRRMWDGLAEVLVEFARFRRRRPDPAAQRVRIPNPEAIAEALAAGKGALFLTAHYGCWEGFAASVVAHGYPMVVLGARQRNPLVERLFATYRERRGYRVITVGKGLRPLVRALDEGYVVGTLADQDGGRLGFFLEFLGRPASVQSGLFRLASRRGTPLIVGFAERTGEAWEARVHGPFLPRPVAGPEAVEEEARRLAAIYNDLVEDAVRRRPDQWFWLHRRWHTRPPQEGPLTRT